MDGPFGVSLYPYYETGKVSLTSVEHTPLGRYATYYEAQEAIASSEFERNVETNRELMEQRIATYIPWFRETYTYDSFSCAIRALPASAADRRTAHVSVEGNVISVLPGKIGGIFDTLEEIKKLGIMDYHETVNFNRIGG